MRKVDLTSSLNKHLGSGAKPGEKVLRNVGPSITYKLRDAAGQAREFHNYMLPIEQGGRWFLYTGLREAQADAFRYMRIPLDESGGVDAWFAIRDRLLDPAQQQSLLYSSDLELGETTRQVFEAVDRTAPARIVLDSLSEIRLLAQSSLRYRRQILALKHYLNQREVSMSALAKPAAIGE